MSQPTILPPALTQLGRFRLARYRFTLEAANRLSLPPYQGSTLRGGFGAAFKGIACAQRDRRECHGCLLHATCPYGYVFETPPPPDSAKLRRIEQVPRPFVLEPPVGGRVEYAPGDRLEFGLVVFGRAIAYFPYFVLAFRELGERGIGRGRGRFRLAAVDGDPPPGLGEPRRVYDGVAGAVAGHDVTLPGEAIIRRALDGLPAADPARFTLRFETPARLKFGDHLCDRPEFHVVVRTLLRRLSALAYFHHGFDLDLDYRGLVERAAAARLAADRTRWADWERYSRRQDGRMKLGGVVGEAVYEAPPGLLAEFVPLLALAEFTHVGKNATFGLGRIRIVPSGGPSPSASDSGS